MHAVHFKRAVTCARQEARETFRSTCTNGMHKRPQAERHLRHLAGLISRLLGEGKGAHRTDKVHKCMHLHEVVLYRCAGHDDRQLHWDLPQLLCQLRARVLYFMPLHIPILYYCVNRATKGSSLYCQTSLAFLPGDSKLTLHAYEISLVQSLPCLHCK